MAARYVIEDLTSIHIEVDLASEFRYRNLKLRDHSLVIIISQSGETADSLAALRLAKEKGVPTLAIVNVIGSTIAREADHVMYTLAGPEIAVATTKAYSTQLIATYLFAVEAARARGEITQEKADEMVTEMQTLPEKIERVLNDKDRIQWFAAKFANAKDMFFIGRGLDYAISLEGSLKNHLSDREGDAGCRRHDTVEAVREDPLQHGGGRKSRRLPDGTDHLWQLQHRGHGELHRLCAKDR